jgi:hypothetical protein
VFSTSSCPAVMTVSEFCDRLICSDVQFRPSWLTLRSQLTWAPVTRIPRHTFTRPAACLAFGPYFENTKVGSCDLSRHQNASQNRDVKIAKWSLENVSQFRYFGTNKLNNCMDLSTTRRPTSCAATQESPNISWNPKVHYRIHNSSPFVPMPNNSPASWPS